MEEKIALDGDLVSSLALAYLGDAVLEIHIREYVLRSGKAKVDDLHRASVRYVCAKAQSRVYDEIGGFLTRDEAEVMNRGRNTKKKIPKNVEMKDYRKSTGFEALLGWLYLEGRQERVLDLVEKAILIIERG